MPKTKTLEEAYDQCLADGLIEEKAEVNTQHVRDMLKIAEIYMQSAEFLANQSKKDDPKWMNVYLDYYEALRIVAEGLAKLSKKGISNHQCLFAFVCSTYPDLELDWDFFEKIRTKRNGAHYYGKLITHEDWSQIQLQCKLYISAIKKKVESMIA